MTTRTLRAAAACALLAGTALAAPAFAQTGASPTFRNLDANGVDLTRGDFLTSFEEGSIGSGEAELALLRMIGATGANGSPGNSQWDHILLNVVENSGVYIDFGSRNDKFPGAESRGSTLSGGDSFYSYRAPDGTVMAFADPNAGSSEVTNFCNGSAQTSCILLPVSITSPDGKKVSLDYEFWTLCKRQQNEDDPTNCTYTPRLSRVSNSDGYSILFSYASAEGGGFANPPASFSQRTGARFHNDRSGTTPLAEVSYAYPSIGVTDITDMGGRAWRVTSGDTGYAIRRPGAATDTTSVVVKSATRVVSSVVNEGVATSYMRSVAGNVATIVVTDALNRQTRVESDLTIGRPTSVTDALNNVTSFRYDPNGRLTRTTMPEGNYVEATYDARGNVKRTDAVAKPDTVARLGLAAATITTSASFDEVCANPVTCNRPNSTTDARGYVTDYVYDPTHGGVLSVTAPAPTNAPGAVRPQTRYGYTLINEEYRLTSTSACQTGATCDGAADEVKTVVGYDVNGNVVSASTGAGNGSLTATSAMTYDARGDLLTVDGPLPGAADTMRVRYNAAREAVGTISPDPDGAGPLNPLKPRAVRTTIDAATGLAVRRETGTVADQSDAAWDAFAPAEATEITYDANARPVTSRLVAGGVTHALTQTNYDALGRVNCTAQRMNPDVYGIAPPDACSLGMAGSFGPDRIGRTLYDAVGRVEQVQTALGTNDYAVVTTSSYRANGQVETLTDGEGNRTVYTYDGHDRPEKTLFPSATTKGATGDYEQLSYDAASNVVARMLRDGRSIAFAYDRLNRVTSKDLPDAEPDVSYGYDALGRMTDVSRPGYAIGFAYDALGRRTAETTPRGAVTSQYDPAGRRTKLIWPVGAGGSPQRFFVDYDYLVTGEMKTIRDPGGAALATFDYDDAGRRKTLTRGNGTSTTYGYDAASRLNLLKQDIVGTAFDLDLSFAYTPASQIASTTRSNDAFAYAGSGSGTLGYSNNGLNQLTAVGGAALAYDRRGNITWDGTNGYRYSSENLMVGLVLPRWGDVTLDYDPLGRFIEAPDVGFLYDGDQLIGELSGKTSGNSPLALYIHGPGADEPLMLIDGRTGERVWFHADERGSVVAGSLANGSVEAVNTYDEYGKSGGSGSYRFGYTGQMRLTDDIYNYKARIYHPGLARFLQPDPIGYAGGMNMYAYVGGDPVNLVDPSGTSGLHKEDRVICSGTRIPGNCGGGGIANGLSGFSTGGVGGQVDAPRLAIDPSVFNGANGSETLTYAADGNRIAVDGAFRGVGAFSGGFAGPVWGASFRGALNDLGEETSNWWDRAQRIGQWGEDQIRSDLIAKGSTIVGEQVRIMTPYGLRITDFIVNPGLLGIEVKTNGGYYSSLQLKKDNYISSYGGTIIGGTMFSPLAIGKRITMQTTIVRIWTPTGF